LNLLLSNTCHVFNALFLNDLQFTV
jgi:hypothetical protein